MCDWMASVGSLLEPVCKAMKRSLIAGNYLQADETPIRVQGLKKGKMHKGYLEHGEAEIDNNSIEKTMCPVALGRRNYLFAGSKNGGKTAAVIYSLVTSCKRLGINPWEYPKDVIDRVSTHPMARVWELTPRGWKEMHENQVQELSGPPQI